MTELEALKARLSDVLATNRRLAEYEADLKRRNAAQAAEIVRFYEQGGAHRYPHICRDGHDEVGWRGEGEQCPVCRERGADAGEREALPRIRATEHGFVGQGSFAVAAKTYEACERALTKAVLAAAGAGNDALRLVQPETRGWLKGADED